MPIDTLKILDRLDFERRTLARSGERLEQFPQLSRLTSPDGSQHAIIYSNLDSENLQSVIAGEIAHYRELNAGVEWKVYQHDSPVGLIQSLENQGFVVGERESVLVLDLLDKHDWLDQPLTHRVERIRTMDQVNLFQQTAEKIFRKNYQFTASELWHGISEQSVEHVGYLCFEGSIPVSIGRLYTHAASVFGGLYGGATLPDYRRVGFYRAITAERGRDARALGARYLIVDALPTSCPILKRLGFVEVSQTWPCVLR